MYTLVHVLPYCYIRFGVPEKGSLSKEHKFSSLKDHVINTRILRNSMKINGVVAMWWIFCQTCCGGTWS